MVAEVRDLAREHTPEAINTSVSSCRMIRPTPASLAASTAILDRGYGKAPASLEVTTLEMISARFFVA